MLPRASLLSTAALAALCTACGGEAPPAGTDAGTATTATEDPAPATDGGGTPAPLETVRNFQVVNERLASAGQIGYDQIPLLGEQGYEVVVNLAIADEERNAREGFLVAEEGLTYVHIPVDWNEPSPSDVRMFFDVMRANQDRKVFVHCFANMRASAFVYMYRTLVEGVPEEQARATMSAVWDPADEPQWAALIEQVRAEYGSDR